MYCTNCGAELMTGANFCAICGAPVQVPSQAQQSASAQQQPQQQPQFRQQPQQDSQQQGTPPKPTQQGSPQNAQQPSGSDEPLHLNPGVQATLRAGTIRDNATGRGLFNVQLSSLWGVKEAKLRSTGNNARPYEPYISIDSDDATGLYGNILLSQGETGMRPSAGLKAALAMYGGNIAGVDTTNYAEMPDPRTIADSLVQDLVSRTGSHGLTRINQQELCILDVPRRQQEAMANFQRIGRAQGGAILKDPFAADVLRIYDFTFPNEQVWRVATFVRLLAAKDASGAGEGPVGMAVGLGGALGSLLGQRKQVQQSTPAAQGSAGWCAPDFESYRKSGTIVWDVNLTAWMATPRELFDEQLSTAFLPLVQSCEMHEDLWGLMLMDARQQAAAMQAATSSAVMRNNMQTQVALESNRQVQQAMDARNASWQAASGAHHAQFRQATNAQFAGPSSGGGAGDFSEAMRGVNTYTTSDGREVEVSTQAEHVYENPGGDILATDSHFEPGGDWTEIPRT